MEPLSSEEHFSPPFLPATHTSRSRTLEEFFELTRSPSRDLNLTSRVAFYNFALRVAEVPGHPQQHIDCVFVPLFLQRILDCKVPTEIACVVSGDRN